MREEHLLTGPLEPTNSAYAVAKIAGVEMCRAYNQQYATSFVPVMPTNLYGPGDNFDLTSSHVLPAMVRKFHLAKLARAQDWAAVARDAERFGPLPDDLATSLGLPPHPPAEPRVILWGTGTPRREFLHVADLARACVHVALETDSTDLVNIGVGQDVSIRELAGLVDGVVGSGAEVVFDTDKPDGTPRKLLDVSRITALGWRPQIGLEQGIARTYEWYLQQT
jgi:GDP-L-fucose synthase